MYRFVAALPQAAGAPQLLLDGGLHVLAAGNLRARLFRPVLRFPQQVAQFALSRGEFALVRRQAAGALYDGCHAATVKGLQPSVGGECGDHAGIKRLVGRVPVQRVLEVRLHLEQLEKLRVVFTQQVIKQAFTQQHHLHVQRNGLRLQAYRAHQAIGLLQAFRTNVPGTQHALQRFPGTWLGEQAAHVEHQVAAVGAVQGAGANQGEIGDQGAVVHVVLGAAHQVLMAGQILVDHGRPAGLAVIDQQVHLEAAEHRLRRNLGCLGKKGRGVGQHGLTTGAQVLQYRSLLSVARLQLGERRLNGGIEHLAVQRVHLLAQLPRQQRHLPDGLGELALQDFHGRFNALLVFLGQRTKILGRHHIVAVALAVDRREGKAVGGGNQQDVLLPRLAPDRLHGIALALPHGLIEVLQSILVFLALKQRGNGGAQFLYQLREVRHQLAPHAGRQRQVARRGRVIEVVAVGPVSRCCLPGGTLRQKLLDQVVTAVAGVAQHIQVKPVAAHGGAETQRLPGAVVAVEQVQRLQPFRGGEVEPIARAGAVDLIRGQWFQHNRPPVQHSGGES